MVGFVVILVFSILIIVHELGHFVMAKKLKVQVDRFSIGFGPTLLKKRFGETEFALCLFPLGGYVKMAGDERQECKGHKNEFFSRSPGHRALIVALGPLVNYIFAFVCFYFVFLTGYPALPAKVGSLMENYPAQEAGFKEGDRILSIEGQAIDSWDEMRQEIIKSKEDNLKFEILREEQKLTKIVTPRVEILENIFKQKEKIRLIGIMPSQAEDIIYLKYGFWGSARRSFNELIAITAMTYKSIYRMVTGAMPVKDSVAGPLVIIDFITKAARLGFTHVILIMALVSASLAIFNLLPLPVLDGGHLLIFWIERIRGKALSAKSDEIINRIGFIMIVSLALFVLANDMEKLDLFDRAIGGLTSLWKNMGF